MNFKKGFLWLCFIMLLRSSHVMASEINDIQTHWAKESIQDAIVDGWVSGYEDATFKPENKVLRIEFLKMLLASSNDFLIVTGGRIYPESYIETAKVKGFLQNEKIEEELKRKDVVDILIRYLDVTNVRASKNVFCDLDDENNEDILKLANLGIVSGYEDNTFRANQKVTRAEAVVMIARATKAKKEMALEKELDFSEALAYTNYQGHEKRGTIFDEESYEINRKELTVYVQRPKKIESDIFDVTNATKVIRGLVNEVGYVGVRFFEMESIPNQLVIAYGQNEKRVANGTNEFTITYFQNRYENLKEKSRVDMFSEKCYMKISIVYLWQDMHEFEKGNFVDEVLKARLEKGLAGEFDRHDAKEVTEYIAEKITEMFAREDHYAIEIGQKKIGCYQIDYYKAENNIPEFYLSKIQ